MSPPRCRHDHDAAGDPDLLVAKAALRERSGPGSPRAARRFRGADGRIPNFVGVEVAADVLRGTDEWQAAGTPSRTHSPQWPVRQRALEDGKTLYMAVPRLADEHPFFLL